MSDSMSMADEAYNLMMNKANQYANQIFEDTKTTLDKELSKLTIPIEKEIEQMKKDSEKSSKEEAKQSLQTISSSAKGATQELKNKEERGNQEIDLHKEEGKLYVKNQQNVLKTSIENAKQAIESKMNQDLQQEQEKLAESIGNTIGNNKVDEHNSKIIKQAKKQYSEAKTSESRASNMGFAAQHVANLQVMALLGINIEM